MAALKNEVFLKIVRGLVNQKLERCLSETGSCVYRGVNGTKCAAGHLIPDKEYKEEFEGNTVRFESSNPICTYFKKKYNNNAEVITLIRRCQQKHDLRESGALGQSKLDWARGMLGVYNEFKINSPTAKAMLETVLAVAE